MMYKKLFVLAMISMLLFNVSVADTVSYKTENNTCVDNQTLRYMKNTSIDGVSNVENHDYKCQYGCTSNYCNPSPLIELFLIIGLFMLISIIVLIITRVLM